MSLTLLLEQFHLLSWNWIWHSTMASFTPCCTTSSTSRGLLHSALWGSSSTSRREHSLSWSLSGSGPLQAEPDSARYLVRTRHHQQLYSIRQLCRLWKHQHNLLYRIRKILDPLSKKPFITDYFFFLVSMYHVLWLLRQRDAMASIMFEHETLLYICNVHCSFLFRLQKCDLRI